MRAVLALSPVRTEAREVEPAEGFAEMGFPAPRPQGTETPLVVWARREFGDRVDVLVQAVVAVGAREVARVVGAFGHASSVQTPVSTQIA